VTLGDSLEPQLSSLHRFANANAGTARYISVYAMRGVASETGDAHHKGQVAEHGFLVE
jgi:hypothetical protein